MNRSDQLNRIAWSGIALAFFNCWCANSAGAAQEESKKECSFILTDNNDTSGGAPCVLVTWRCEEFQNIWQGYTKQEFCAIFPESCQVGTIEEIGVLGDDEIKLECIPLPPAAPPENLPPSPWDPIAE